MKYSKTCSLATALFVALLGGGALADTFPNTAALSVEIHANKTTYTLGEPVSIDLNIANNSAYTMDIVTSDCLGGRHAFLITNSAGEAVLPPVLSWHPGRCSGHFTHTTLAPHTSTSDASTYFSKLSLQPSLQVPQQAGSYFVRLVYFLDCNIGGRPVYNVPLISNQLAFSVSVKKVQNADDANHVLAKQHRL